MRYNNIIYQLKMNISCGFFLKPVQAIIKTLISKLYNDVLYFTDDRSIFLSSTRWLRPTIHINLYNDEIKIIWNH